MKEVSQKMLCLLSALFIALIAYAPVNVLAATIKIVKPDALDEFMNLHVTRVFIDGVIDENTPRQLENALSGLGQSQWVFLNSPGGSLFAGLETGRILRKYSSTTYVGEYRFTGNQTSRPRVYDVDPGKCESACAFAFMGGYYRFMYSEESKLGVHRFWDASGPKSSDLDRGQIITTAVVNYLTEMSVEPSLMSHVVSADKQSMRYLDAKTMIKLNVINDGRAPPTWTIDYRNNRLFLIGSQDIMTGGGTFAFTCDANRLVMLTEIEVGARTAKMIISEKFTPYFLTKKIGAWTPDTTLKINPTVLVADGDSVDTTFVLTYQLEKNLNSLSAFGIGFVSANNPDIFIGTAVDIGNDGNRKRIRDFFSACR